jgi:hypothetical protein
MAFEGVKMAIAASGKEVKILTNRAGLQQLAGWASFLLECPKGEVWEIHASLQLCASEDSVVRIVEQSSLKNMWFGEASEDEEFTIAILPDEKMDLLLADVDT